MVFISYSSKDVEDVKRLAAFVESTGQKCGYSDRDIDKSKDDWMEVLMRTLKQSEKVIVYITDNAIKSGEVKNEITNASAQGLNVIPLIAQDVIIPDSYIYLIRKYEWIKAYMLDDKTVKDILRKRLLENYNEMRNSFWKTQQTKEFEEFVDSLMKRYYGSRFFTKINDKEFGVFCVPGKRQPSVKSIKDFDILCDFDNSVLSDFDIYEHQSYTNNKWYAEYSKILEGKLRYPNRPGYMLDEITTDTDGCFDKLRVHVGTFAENVYSTHVLEYELYRAYLEFKGKNIDNLDIWQKVKESLSIRNKIHENALNSFENNFDSCIYSSLLSGNGRDSLLSVQMLVIIKSERTHKYEAKIIQRSNDVIIKPGMYQFIPSGGFEILNDSDDDIYDDLELEDNFSPGCAVFREYLEELFNVPEFEGGGTGSIEERLLKDKRIMEIEDMLHNGDAEFQFLGSVIDLAGLRHELSFVLVIHDETYSKTQFLANEESKKGAIYNIPIQDLENRASIWKKIHAPSAAMWYLFKQTQLYQSLIRE